jgi:hypothetical protein
MTDHACHGRDASEDDLSVVIRIFVRLLPCQQVVLRIKGGQRRQISDATLTAFRQHAARASLLFHASGRIPAGQQLQQTRTNRKGKDTSAGLTSYWHIRPPLAMRVSTADIVPRAAG